MLHNSPLCLWNAAQAAAILFLSSVPLQAPKADIALFKNKYSSGWNKPTKARFARQVELGLASSAWTPPSQPFNAYTSSNPLNVTEYGQQQEVYAAMARDVLFHQISLVFHWFLKKLSNFARFPLVCARELCQIAPSPLVRGCAAIWHRPLGGRACTIMGETLTRTL